MRTTIVGLCLAALAVGAAGCDSNPDAPTAPEGVIHSNSDDGVAPEAGKPAKPRKPRSE